MKTARYHLLQEIARERRRELRLAEQAVQNERVVLVLSALQGCSWTAREKGGGVRFCAVDPKTGRAVDLSQKLDVFAEIFPDAPRGRRPIRVESSVSPATLGEDDDLDENDSQADTPAAYLVWDDGLWTVESCAAPWTIAEAEAIAREYDISVDWTQLRHDMEARIRRATSQLRKEEACLQALEAILTAGLPGQKASNEDTPSEPTQE